MTHRSNGLLASALAVSAGVHLLLLLLVPWKPMQPRMTAREIVPVRLVHVSPAARPPVARAEPPRPRVIEVPPPEAVTAIPEELAPPMPTEHPVEAQLEPSEPAPDAELAITSDPAPATASEEVLAVPATPVPLSAEIAAYKAILSILRERIISETRYPAIARANGWKGRVILAVRLDEKGKLLQAVVRRSSGYEVLDRAAVTLMRRITPVENPLAEPVTIEVPILYELK